MDFPTLFSDFFFLQFLFTALCFTLANLSRARVQARVQYLSLTLPSLLGTVAYLSTYETFHAPDAVWEFLHNLVIGFPQTVVFAVVIACQLFPTRERAPFTWSMRTGLRVGALLALNASLPVLWRFWRSL